MNGILLIDKPAGVMSHDVVNHVRHATGIRRVGHTGTLDPAATGLLILCLGRATRLSEFLTGLDKVYEGAMRLGLITDSYDMDGAIVEERSIPEMDAATIEQAFGRFTGVIQQVPPMFSAVKVEGRRLYTIARKGGDANRKARQVTVHEFSLLSYDPPLARFRLRCTRGTYARSLCHDVGQLLGCGATLDSLRRTWVGAHSVDQAQPIERMKTREDVAAHLVPMERALDLPEVFVSAKGREIVVRGGRLTEDMLESKCQSAQGWIQVKSDSGELLALAEIKPTRFGIELLPKRVFRTS